MTNIKTLEELGRIIFELSGLDNEYDRKILEQSLNLYIEGKMKEARLDELKHIDDPANVRLWFDGYYGVKERIEELEK